MKRETSGQPEGRPLGGDAREALQAAGRPGTRPGGGRAQGTREGRRNAAQPAVWTVDGGVWEKIIPELKRPHVPRKV